MLAPLIGEIGFPVKHYLISASSYLIYSDVAPVALGVFDGLTGADLNAICHVGVGSPLAPKRALGPVA